MRLIVAIIETLDDPGRDILEAVSGGAYATVDFGDKIVDLLLFWCLYLFVCLG